MDDRRLAGLFAVEPLTRVSALSYGWMSRFPGRFIVVSANTVAIRRPQTFDGKQENKPENVYVFIMYTRVGLYERDSYRTLTLFFWWGEGGGVLRHICFVFANRDASDGEYDVTIDGNNNSLVTYIIYL